MEGDVREGPWEIRIFFWAAVAHSAAAPFNS